MWHKNQALLDRPDWFNPPVHNELIILDVCVHILSIYVFRNT